MSNPGVLILSQVTINQGKKFRVEDNLGESIHIHYNDIRIDLTIRELLVMAETCKKVIYDMVSADNFNLDDFNEDFLIKYAPLLVDLVKVEKIDKCINELLYYERNCIGVPVNRKISKYKEICNEEEDYLPVIFNGINVLMYGREKVSNAFKDGCESVTVINMVFEDEKYSPILHPEKEFFFKWNKQRIKKVLNKLLSRLFKV